MTWQPIKTAPKDGTRILLAWRRLTQDFKSLTDHEIIIGFWGPVWSADAPPEWLGENVASTSPHEVRLVSALTLRGDFAKHPPFCDVGPTHWAPIPAFP